MKQGRMLLLLALAGSLVATVLPQAPATAAARHASASTASAPKKGASLRQFTGVVTAVDKSSLTVQKSGREARSMVFARLPETRTTGEIEKDARVTVWYRDEGGRSVAHRVVVKTATRGAEG